MRDILGANYKVGEVIKQLTEYREYYAKITSSTKCDSALATELERLKSENDGLLKLALRDQDSGVFIWSNSESLTKEKYNKYVDHQLNVTEKNTKLESAIGKATRTCVEANS